MNLKMSEDKLREAVSKIMNDEECGKVFRVKGFMQIGQGKWIELNATKTNLTMKPIENGQEILIIIGEELKEEKIKEHLQ